MESDTALTEFIRLAREWSSGFRKVIRTYIAFKRQGEWFVEHATVVFVADLFEGDVGLPYAASVETETLLAVREIIDFEGQFLETFMDGKNFDPFNLSNETYQVTAPPLDSASPWYSFEPFTRAQFPGNWRWPALTARINTTIRGHMLPNRDRLDLELLSNSIPYSGILDLFEAFGVPQSIMQSHYSSPQATWVISHPAVVTPRSLISNDNIHIEIKCPASLDHKYLSLGARIFTGQAPIERKNIPISNFEWIESGRWKTGVFEEPANGAAIADIHLSFRREFLGHHWISDPRRSLNSRFHLHRLFDAKGVIGPEFFSLKPDFFEDSISLLLSLYGLSSVTYGGIPMLKDAPDILAYSATGHLFVIECTTTDVGRSGKLLKLSQRTREIKETIGQTGTEIVHVLPVMCTTLYRDETKACWDEAADFGIALVCRENLQNLIKGVEAPSSPTALYDAAVKLIPNKSVEQGKLSFGE